MRNFLHYRFNLHTNFDLRAYERYLVALRSCGVTEIEHAAQHIVTRTQEERVRRVVDIIHEQGLKAILYTGVFGTEGAARFRQWAQRDENGQILGYGGKGWRTAMMCPASPYPVEVTLPQLTRLLGLADFDGIFIDIPWFLRDTCYCSHCTAPRQRGADNAAIVRASLETIVATLKQEKPELRLAVNASAPTIHDNRYNGAHIDNLAGLFDEYVTEWNPYRWRQPPTILVRSLLYAHQAVTGRLLHATTMTTRGGGRPYSLDNYTSLFSAILAGGATPRLGITFPEELLQLVGEAWRRARALEGVDANSLPGSRA